MKKILAFALFMGALCFQAEAKSLNDICNKIVGDTCIITNNGGGRDSDFAEAAAELKARNMRLKVVGRCDSACVQRLVRDMQPRACATSSATFATHRGITVLEENYVAGLPVITGDEKTFGAAKAVQAGLIAPCPGHQGLRTASTGHPAPVKTARGTLVIAGCDPWGSRYRYRCGE